MEEQLYLEILASLSEKAKGVIEVQGDNWFFVDYSPKQLPLGKIGDFEILEVYDQFSNSIGYIPAGGQTICRITGIDKSNLPEKHAWYPNETSIKIPL